MKTLARLLLALTAFVAVYFFAFWLVFPLLSGILKFGMAGETLQMAAVFLSLLLAVYAALYTWKKLKQLSPGWASSMLTGGIIVGSIGFAAGFFGPLIFRPDQNLGPLLGILITGPAGFLVGLLLGALRKWLQLKKHRNAEPDQTPVEES